MPFGLDHESHLLTADEALQAVIQNAPVSIAVIDSEGRLMFAAGKGLELIDMTAEMLVGSKATDLFPEQGRIPELMKKVFAGEALNVTLDLKGRVLEVWATPIRNKAGKIVAALNVATDVTDRERSLRKLEETERIVSLAEQAAQFGIWYSDPSQDGKLVWSDGTYRIFGIPKKEFDGRVETFFKLVHPDDLERVRKASLDALAGVSRYNVEHRVIRPDGQVRWVHQEADVSFGPGRKPRQMVGMAQDITDRKSAEEAIRRNEAVLRASEARYRAMIEHSYELVHMLDDHGRISYMSPAVGKMLGYAAEELIGAVSDSFVHPDDQKRVAEQLKPILHRPGEATPPTPMRIRRKDGTYLAIEAVAHNLLHIPEVAAIVVHSRDASVERRMTAELERRNEELEQFVRLTTGREDKMMELKKENEELKKRLSGQS
ncbi:MAG TPA: PAS domain S-box protein [Candidatus Baltobacteraceae bacterium]|nr:PAS domain S-box protein [Candidatus Baltobacteraceae bacterium]